MYITGDATKVVAGIDVGKANLDVSVNAGSVRRFANTDAGIVELLNWLKSEEVVLAVCEPTGGYERGLVRALRSSPIQLCVVHPNRCQVVRSRVRTRGEDRCTGRCGPVWLRTDVHGQV